MFLEADLEALLVQVEVALVVEVITIVSDYDQQLVHLDLQGDLPRLRVKCGEKERRHRNLNDDLNEKNRSDNKQQIANDCSIDVSENQKKSLLGIVSSNNTQKDEVNSSILRSKKS